MDNQKEVDYIFKLCEDWLSNVIQPDGSGHHTAESDSLLLYRNISFHELSINGIQAACVGLTNKLHYRNLGIFINRDHIVFWSWIGQLFCNSTFEQTPSIGNDLHSHLCGIIFPILLASDDILFDSPIDDSLKIIQGYDFHLRKIVSSRWNILRYVSYPFLEAVTRILCRNYVDKNGEVVQQFSVPQNNNQTRTYRVGNRCSSLRDLLRLLESSVAGNELKYFLARIKGTIVRITSNPNPYGTLYSWRNQTLHGNEFSGVAGCLLLNISILLLLELIRKNYLELSQTAFANYRQAIGSSRWLAPIYYTPDLPN